MKWWGGQGSPYNPSQNNAWVTTEAREDGIVSGHGKREKILKADATRWRNRVRADLASPAGCAAMSEHKLLSVRSVDDVADVIASHIAAGDMLVPFRGSRRRLVARFLAARGHVEIVQSDLIRPVGVREGELFG
jgi:hypothetical protein